MGPLGIMLNGGMPGIPKPGCGGRRPGLWLAEGWTWGESMGLCMGLEGGPKFLGGGCGGPMPGIIGLDRGLFGPAEGRRYGGRICCII